jgi:hypothetical protein
MAAAACILSAAHSTSSMLPDANSFCLQLALAQCGHHCNGCKLAYLSQTH